MPGQATKTIRLEHSLAPWEQIENRALLPSIPSFLFY